MAPDVTGLEFGSILRVFIAFSRVTTTVSTSYTKTNKCKPFDIKWSSYGGLDTSSVHTKFLTMREFENLTPLCTERFRM